MSTDAPDAPGPASAAAGPAFVFPELDCFTDDADDSSHLRNLLAIIHGDGGHHTAAVGVAQSCRDAVAEFHRLREELAAQERVTAALGDLARATINALRGDPPHLTTWSTHDLPDVARAMREKLLDAEHDARKWHVAAEDAFVDNEYHRAEVRRLRGLVKEFERLADCVRAEHTARTAWLTTLPGGSCGNPPPQALLDAEAATQAALDAAGWPRR